MKSLMTLLLILIFMGNPSAIAAPIYFTDFSSFDEVTTTTVIEDFEAITPKNIPRTSFISNGNTYTGFTGRNFPNVVVTEAGAPNFSVPMTSSVLAANGNEDLMVEFGNPTNALGFDTYLNIYGPATIQIFDDSGLADIHILDQDPSHIGFFGMIMDEPISSIRWTAINGQIMDTGIDNIRQGSIHSVDPVPEPATMTLLFTGLFGLLGSSRITRKKS